MLGSLTFNTPVFSSISSASDSIVYRVNIRKSLPYSRSYLRSSSTHLFCVIFGDVAYNFSSTRQHLGL